MSGDSYQRHLAHIAAAQQQAMYLHGLGGKRMKLYSLSDCDRSHWNLEDGQRPRIIQRVNPHTLRVEGRYFRYLLESECIKDYYYLLQYYNLPRNDYELGSIVTINNEPKKENAMKEILTDIRGYMKEHKNIIFTVAVVLLADHFLFNGALRERIKGLVEGLLKKAEDKIAKSE